MAIGETVITIVGNLTADPELRTTGQGAQVAKAAAVVLKACRTVMDTKNKQEHIDKWGGIHAITEAVYDCADLAQRSLDMEDGDVEASIDPDTGEIG